MKRHRGAVALALTLAACVPAKREAPAQARISVPDAWREPDVAIGEVDAQWWKAFNDPALVKLVDAALAHNTDLLVSSARVEQARAQLGIASSTRWPSLNAVIGAQRTRTLGDLGESIGSAIQPQLSAAWELDLWGRLAKLERAAQLQYAATHTERDAAALSLAAQTASAYLTLVSLDTQLLVTKKTVESRQRALDLFTDRARVGYTSQLELSQAQSEFEAVQQAVPQIEFAIRRQENAIRLLTGDLPGPIERGLPLIEIQPPEIPAVLPSTLLRRRPDLVQAELALAAADTMLAARRADFLPSVSLSASVGRLYVDALDYDPVQVWSIGGSVLAPIFNAGRIRSQFDAATAQRDQAAFAYRGVTLRAFGEVENALAGVDSYRAQIERLHNRREILGRSLTLAHDRFRAGYSSYLEELDAQRNLYNTELSAISVRESQLLNLVNLYRVLGGGWSAPTTAPPPPTEP
ncbi:MULTISPECIES: efflux transporter outer membrane subunit [Hydrocarboniphaga]|uniref:efflux transporter outer membrane subunit n=1 Tax=Hydrocarboniphaga TaxID=243627 RepID=UPI002ABCEFA7|nr:efflux transporter outer membrane subunit [Hydrocarboniphaga sp.]MDZ4080291.1 efflux transporter outer membrane subunit [Hydrocarboniphaga sp.]